MTGPTPNLPPRRHIPTRVELKLVWRSWCQTYNVYYICSCGRRLKQHGDHTLTHFQPDIYGWTRVGNELDELEKRARAELQQKG